MSIQSTHRYGPGTTLGLCRVRPLRPSIWTNTSAFGVGVSALVIQKTQLATEPKASAAGTKLGADVGKKGKNNTPNGKDFAAATAEEAP